MQLTEILLMVITIALLGIWMSVSKMSTRLREHWRRRIGLGDERPDGSFQAIKRQVSLSRPFKGALLRRLAPNHPKVVGSYPDYCATGRW
jgi:hypothetical protein